MKNAVQNAPGTFLRLFYGMYYFYHGCGAWDVILGTLTAQQGAELLGARMVGRWRSGAPVDLSPTEDDPALGADPQRNNNFDFAHNGSDITQDQSRCPFSAHIRKTRPRADLRNLNVVNQGIRGGIPFGPEVTPPERSSGTTSELRGLAFGVFTI